MSWRNELTVGIMRAERFFIGTTNGGLGSELDLSELSAIDGVVAGTGAANKALVLDSSADITGGINDFTIDNALTVGNGLALLNGALTVGVDDSVAGVVRLYGDTGINGGRVDLYNGATEDDDQQFYRIEANDALEISRDTTVLMDFDYNGSTINFYTLDVKLSNNLLVEGGTAYVGDSGVRKGDLYLYGAATGSANGGKVTLFTADDYDASINSYYLEADGDDFWISPDGSATEQFGYAGGSARWEFDSATAVYFDCGVELAGTLNVSVITGSPRVNALSVGQSDTAYGHLELYGHTTGSVQGGKITLYTAADHDATVNSFTIEATSEVLNIGGANNLTAIQVANAIINLNESVYSDQPIEFASTLNISSGAGQLQIGGSTVNGTAAELNYNAGVTLGTTANSKVLTLDAGGNMTGIAGDWGLTAVTSIDIAVGALEIAGVSVTSTAAELNILDGVTSTYQELNLVDNQVGSVAFTPAGGAGSGTVQCTFSDANGVQMATASSFKFWFSSVSTGLDFLPITTSVVTSKGAVDKAGGVAGSDVFHGITDAAGEFDVTVTAAADDYYMVVELPSGKLQIAAVLTLS